MEIEAQLTAGTTPGLAKVVIVGGGFGGLQAARALAHTPVAVTVIDRTNHHLFQPLLYQVATAGLSPADISAPIRGILHNDRRTEVMMAEVLGIDRDRSAVTTDYGLAAYDFLVLAPGSAYNYFGHGDWDEFAPSLKSIPDALRIRQRVLTAFERAEMEPNEDRRRALLTFVVVGAGPTGVELAGAIAELSHRTMVRDFRHIRPETARILLLEAGPRILPSFTERMSRAAASALARLGAKIRTGAKVEAIDPTGVVVAGQRIPSHVVLWTAGVVAAPVGKWLGVETDRVGRIVVQPDLTVPGMPNVFVIGDAAAVMHDGRPLPGIAPVAMQEGRYAARVIAARVGDRPMPESFRYRDKGNLATVGRSFAVAEVGKLRAAGLLGWVTWLMVHIWYLIGFRNRLMVLLQWAWAYVTWERGARLITASHGTSPAGPAGDTRSTARRTSRY